MDPAALQECLDVLLEANALGEDADLELLTALTIIGVANPELAESQGFTGLATARRVAARLEQQGDADAALAIIEHMRFVYPGHQALERDYDAVLGRLGMVLNLADRYYDRAQQLLSAGEKEEAVNWLREVLLLDASRKDVARQIRDLRLDGMRPKTPFRIRWGLVSIGICLPLATAGVVNREKRLIAEYEGLPSAMENDLQTGEARLKALDQFAKDNPVWHRSIDIKRERTDLRLDVVRLSLLDQKRRLEQAERLESDRVKANSLRSQARRKVGDERFQEALSLFEQAMQAAPPGWQHREQTSRDIAVIRTHIADMESGKETR